MLLSMIAAATTSLVLDARRSGPACPPAVDGGEVVVCATRIYPATILPVTIAGTPARLLIEPGGHDELTCNPDFVRRAGITGDGPRRLATIGPVAVDGLRASVSMTLAGQTRRYRAAWTARPLTTEADCVIGPQQLPFTEIKFLFDGSPAGAVPFVLPIRGRDGRSYGQLQVGRHAISLRFEHRWRRTVLTASAAHTIAPVHGGTATGPVLPDEISYGIVRPVRALVLDRPLRLGRLTLAAPFVRVADFGNAANIRSLAADEADPDAVVVAGKRRAPGGTRLVRVGGDDLDRCVSLTLDKRRRQIMLVC